MGISAIAIIPCVVLFQFVDVILGLVEHQHDVLHYGQLFGRFGSLFLYPLVLYMALRQYFQSMRVVLPATFVSVICIGINIGLNQLFIYGINIELLNSMKFEFNGFGFIGSPIATSFSYVIQLLMFTIYVVCYKKYHKMKKTWNGWQCKESFEWYRIKNFFSIVAPLMLADASENWGMLFICIYTYIFCCILYYIIVCFGLCKHTK